MPPSGALVQSAGKRWANGGFTLMQGEIDWIALSTIG
jgi:hypothetical protein